MHGRPWISGKVDRGYKKEVGETLTREEARERMQRVGRLSRLLCKPVPSEKRSPDAPQCAIEFHAPGWQLSANGAMS